MSALNYLPESQRIQIKPFKVEPQPTDTNKMAYLLIVYISTDIAVILETLAEDGIINTKASKIQGFLEKANKDLKTLTQEAKERGYEKRFLNGLSVFLIYFKELAERSLSAYQKQNAPILIDILTAIYEIRTIKDTFPYIMIGTNQKLNPKPYNFILEQERLLMRAFNQIFNKYSNLKFDFSKFDKEIKELLNPKSKLLQDLWNKTIKV